MKKLLLLAVAVLLYSCGPKKTDAQLLVERIQKIQEKGYMFGHQDDPFYGTTWEWELDKSDTRLVTGDYPGVMGFELGGIEKDDAKNLDSVPFVRIHDEIINHYERGGVITISWHPRNPKTGGTAWDVTDRQTVKSILPGGQNHDQFMLWMGRMRTFLTSLKDSNGNQVPFMLRPWHEYNGSWFWWGQRLCSDDEFLTLWNMFQDYMNEELKDYVVWSFSPNLQGNWTADAFEKRYPGDDRVDLIGEDCYQWGTEKDFVTQSTADLKFLSQYASEHGKLLAVTECGYQNSPDPTWWTRVLKPVLDQFPVSYMLCWRNASTEHFGPAPDLATKDDFVKFYKAENTLFLEDIR